MIYECHITTTVQHAEQAELIAFQLGWKTSEIKRDPLLGDGSHFYLTAHDPSYTNISTKMHETARWMAFKDLPVLRMKIEAIIYDTKTGTKPEVAPQ